MNNGLFKCKIFIFEFGLMRSENVRLYYYLNIHFASLRYAGKVFHLHISHVASECLLMCEHMGMCGVYLGLFFCVSAAVVC